MAEDKSNSSNWFPIVILILLIAGAGNYATRSNTETPARIPLTNIDSPAVRSYTNPQHGFLFSHPDTLFVHERPNGIILLPSPTFPDIASEVYALGTYIILTKSSMVGPYERVIDKAEFVQNITTEDNMYEGKPTKVTWEKINGLDMLRIEHRNVDAPHTLNYYVFNGGDYYNIQMHPYNGIDLTSREYLNFMTVVNSFSLVNPLPVVINPQPPTNPIGGACYVGGCSAQLCSDRRDVITTCEYLEVYDCFKTAKCERQSTGQCGWTDTPALRTCVQQKS